MVNDKPGSSGKLPCPKVHQKKKLLVQKDVREMIQPTINITHKPTKKTGIDTWALGSMIMNVHNGVNKCVSNQTVIDYNDVGHQMVKDYHYCVSQSKKEFSSIPVPPRVTLNTHNIVDVHRSLYETYRWKNTDPKKTYRLLEKCTEFSIMHDATSYWVKQLNTVMIRVVTDEMDVVRVPFSFKNVPSLTGEALCEEIIDAVSAMKKVKNNASETIFDALRNDETTNDAKKVYKDLCAKLETAARTADFDEMGHIQDEMKKLVAEHPDVKTADGGGSDSPTHPPPPGADNEILPPATPNYFKIATLASVDKADKTIHLEVQPKSVPTCQCGDGCSTNMKGARLVAEKIGLKAPFMRCSSHAASGTVRRLCTSATMCDDNAKALYNNLKVLLKHFSMSNKSSELLNNALSALEMNNIHILNWGSTRMAGFLDACLQSSKIIIPLLDTIITMNIRPDETSFIGSAKGVYMLQLFADLHKLFADKYLHKVDADGNKMLSCEAFNVAKKTAEKLESVSTPLADHLLESLHEDQYRNLMVSFKIKDDVHVVRLNERLTNRNKSLQAIKQDLQEMKKGIINNMIENINDQNTSGSLLGLMSAFDLNSSEEYDTRADKISQMYDMYGVDNEHIVDEEWNGFKVKITYKRRLHCSKQELLQQFEKAWPKINTLSQELHEAREGKNRKLQQFDLWKKFLQTNQIGCRYLCKLIAIMFSIPVNTGWVERASSTLEMICQKRRNQLDVQGKEGKQNLKYLFFLAILKLPIRDAFSYEQEINNIGKTNFPRE